MKKAMLFSGGFDSTYLLNELMQEENEVTIVCIESNLLGKEKVNRETEARKKIIDYLKAKYYNCRLNVINANIGIDTECSYWPNSNRGLAQPLMWLPYMCLLTSDCDEIDLSYICGDQALTHMDDLIKVITAAAHFQHTDIGVRFPLRYYYKKDIIHYLYNKDKFLLENSTSCENLDEEDFCGECTPCSHLIAALLELVADKYTYRDERMYYINFLKDKFGIDANITRINESKKDGGLVVDEKCEENEEEKENE